MKSIVSPKTFEDLWIDIISLIEYDNIIFTLVHNKRNEVVEILPDEGLLVVTKNKPELIKKVWIENAWDALYAQKYLFAVDIPGQGKYRSSFITALLARLDYVYVEKNPIKLCLLNEGNNSPQKPPQTIVLISCVSKKLENKSKVKDLYISQLFKLNLLYSSILNPHKVFILSAKHGLLHLNDEIEPYDETLNTKSAREVINWAEKVLDQLAEQADLTEDKFIFFAGNNYRKHLIPKLENYEIPMKGLPIGKQLQFLKEQIAMRKL